MDAAAGPRPARRGRRPRRGPPPPAPRPAAAGGRQGAGRGQNALAQLSDEKRAELQTKLAALDEKFPPPARANVKDFVNHIDYAVKKIGIDHVGISSDFDGGGGVDGWNGADETFNVTLELVRRGYTEEQIGKIWSGNLLRVHGRSAERRASKIGESRSSSLLTPPVMVVSESQARFASLTISPSRTITAAPSSAQNQRGEMNGAASARADSGPAFTSVAGAPMSFGASSDRS